MYLAFQTGHDQHWVYGGMILNVHGHSIQIQKYSEIFSFSTPLIDINDESAVYV